MSPHRINTLVKKIILWIKRLCSLTSVRYTVAVPHIACFSESVQWKECAAAYGPIGWYGPAKCDSFVRSFNIQACRRTCTNIEFLKSTWVKTYFRQLSYIKYRFFSFTTPCWTTSKVLQKNAFYVEICLNPHVSLIATRYSLWISRK